VLKSTAKWAWKVKRWTRDNLSAYVQMIDPRKEVIRTRTLSQAEIEALIKKAETFEIKAFIAFGAYAILRQGEVMALTPKDISPDYVRAQSKDGPVRTVPVVPQLRPYLKAVPFTRHKRTLYAGFEAARDAAGFKDVVYHDLRRSGATILLNAGVPLEVVSALLGHKSLETTRKIYAHVLQPTLQKAMRKGFQPIRIPSGKGGPGGI
jgi:integrase